MERHNINQIPIPHSGQDSYIDVLSSIFKGKKDYERSENEECSILHTKEIFLAAVETYKAPKPIPTIFRNHSERGTCLGLEHRKRKVDPKNPPEESFVIFTFADDIFANVIINFRKESPEGKQNPYLLHNKSSKIVCLRQEFSAEEAFEEALLPNPPIYSDNIEVVKKSPYVDQDTKSWKTQEGCMAEYSRIEDNEIQFIVDFSVIYPQNIWSTAFVLCYDCGRYAEIALCDAVKETARKEIWHNITQCDIEKDVSERGRCVIRLPMRNSLHAACSFREGLIGFTPLPQSNSMKPSLYVRTRITFYTNEESRIGHVLHKKCN